MTGSSRALPKAIELEPKMAHGYLSRSAAYLGLGDNNRAIADANKAIKASTRKWPTAI